MNSNIYYTFDDEYVDKFCLDMENKKIEVHFAGYFDLKRNESVDEPCVWVIEDWKYANSSIGDEDVRYDLNRHLGIFSLILNVRFNDNGELEVLVMTVDNRFPTLFFKEPKLSLGPLI